MRADMSKVLVEEPRSGRAFARAVAGSRRRERERLDPDGESAPRRFGMKQHGGDKQFGEHLGPLYAYLRQQVDRPWSKVYGELCQGLDRRNTVQAHLFQHLFDRVEVNTEWRDGQVWVAGRWPRRQVPLAESWAELYVHPRTGILLVNRARLAAKRKRQQARIDAAQVTHANRRLGGPGMAANEQWHRVDGVWYAVTLGEIQRTADPKTAPLVYDVLLKRAVGWPQHEMLYLRYGPVPGSLNCRYAATKRQLDSRSLRQQGLTGG